MSLNLTEFVRMVKKAAVDAVLAQKPMAYCYGEVTSVSPLKISIDQKLTLTEKQLSLTNAVRDFSVNVSEKKNGVIGESKEYIIHLGLQVGERVKMLRSDGGQKYIVLDRAEVSE